MSPRLLVIMGSGETSPTMVKTHREVFARLDPAAPAVALDTPFGFQENADDISARAIEYFRSSVGRAVVVASFRRAAGMDPLQRESTLARIGAAQWVFAGPGSPTYTLRQWSGTEIPSLLADKLHHGGVVNFASAAALTLGRVTVPVYEIYKVGAEVAWAEGLDLLGPLGLHVAVIPHYDNAEGGNHDTRFCYLGERRLRMLEDQLAPEVFVLGVDEHTGCVLDLDAASATVVGLGGVTVRHHGSSAVLQSGTTLAISALVELAAGISGSRAPSLPGSGAPSLPGSGSGAPSLPGSGAPSLPGSGAPSLPGSGSGAPSLPGSGARAGAGSSGSGLGAGAGARAATPLLATIRELEAMFDTAVAARDIDGAVLAILSLDDALAAWRGDTLQSDEQDRGRGALRRMVVRLGEVARVGVRDPRVVIGPFVSLLLGLRDAARQGRRFEEADGIRDQLVALGITIRDTATGTEWDPPPES